jgi:hypothetical protein
LGLKNVWLDAKAKRFEKTNTKDFKIYKGETNSDPIFNFDILKYYCFSHYGISVWVCLGSDASLDTKTGKIN